MASSTLSVIRAWISPCNMLGKWDDSFWIYPKHQNDYAWSACEMLLCQWMKWKNLSSTRASITSAIWKRGVPPVNRVAWYFCQLQLRFISHTWSWIGRKWRHPLRRVIVQTKSLVTSGKKTKGYNWVRDTQYEHFITSKYNKKHSCSHWNILSPKELSDGAFTLLSSIS